MIKPKDSNELFAQLRIFAEKFQCLHELHTDHIKKWPFAVNPNVEKSTAKVDFDKKQLIYLWGFKKNSGKDPEDYQHRLQELCKGIRFILGDSWSVKIQNLNTKEVIFTSEDASTGPAEKPRKQGRSRTKRLANRCRKKRVS